jgi:hypothetical protein
MLKPTNTYCIAFDTMDMPGKIVATQITLETVVFGNPKDVFRIDLKNHPLYYQLVDYVKSNPIKRRK